MRQQGFSLIELITVMIIVGVLAAVTGSRMAPTSAMQLQAARDHLLAALLIAQQKAMAQTAAVQLETGGSTIDIRVDSNGDGVFSAGESLSHGGVTYPYSLAGQASFSAQTRTFDRLGHTQPGSVGVSVGGQSVNVTVTGTGYAY